MNPTPLNALNNCSLIRFPFGMYSMTRNNLNSKQILKFEEATPGGKLINALDLAFVINFLLDPKSRGINGQSIVVDNGWSINRD